MDNIISNIVLHKNDNKITTLLKLLKDNWKTYEQHENFYEEKIPITFYNSNKITFSSCIGKNALPIKNFYCNQSHDVHQENVILGGKIYLCNITKFCVVTRAKTIEVYTCDVYNNTNHVINFIWCANVFMKKPRAPKTKKNMKFQDMCFNFLNETHYFFGKNKPVISKDKLKQDEQESLNENINVEDNREINNKTDSETNIETNNQLREFYQSEWCYRETLNEIDLPISKKPKLAKNKCDFNIVTTFDENQSNSNTFITNNFALFENSQNNMDHINFTSMLSFQNNSNINETELCQVVYSNAADMNQLENYQNNINCNETQLCPVMYSNTADVNQLY